MNNSIWTALAGWCLIQLQLVLKAAKAPLFINNMLGGAAIAVFIFAIIFAVRELKEEHKRKE